jgi:hypothetical protein
MKHDDEKYKRNLLTKCYEEDIDESAYYPSDEENPCLEYNLFFQEQNADTRSFECSAHNVITEEPLPDVIRENMNLLKYYKKRHIIFSKYDEGIQLDKGVYFYIPFLIIDENFSYTYACVLIIHLSQRVGIP